MTRSSLLLLLALVTTMKLKVGIAAPAFPDRNEDMQEEALDRELRGAKEDLELFLEKRQNELAAREDSDEEDDEVNQRAVLSLEEPYGGNFQPSKRGPKTRVSYTIQLNLSFDDLKKMLQDTAKIPTKG